MRVCFSTGGVFFVAAIVAGAVACSSTPAPEEPEADPTSTATADVSVKPPEKKCETLTEECSATGDTQAKVPGSDFVFIPPIGWIYAQESGQTVTRRKGPDAAMAVAAFEGTEPKTKEVLLSKLASSIGVTIPEKKRGKVWTPTWEKPDDKMKVAEVELSLYQADGAKRGDLSGPMLVFLTKDSVGKNILGVAFSPEGDQGNQAVQEVLKSLETFGPGSYQ